MTSASTINALTTKSLSNETINSSFSTTMASNKWLLANSDPSANLYTIPGCIALADMMGDGDYKLLIADLGFSGLNGGGGGGSGKPKLRVYRGTTLHTESTLVDIPSGIAVFYTEGQDPQSPAIAVASGSYLYVYKNMKPFYKFCLPTHEVNPTEMDAWLQAKDQKIDAQTLKDLLNNIRLETGDTGLTSRSQALISMTTDDSEQMDQFVQLYRDQMIHLKRQTVITCLSTIKKTVNDENAVSCLIIGTENRDIYILEPDAFTILVSATLPSAPVFIESNGLFDVEFRLLVSCRDAHIYTIKRGYKSGRLCVQLSSQPVGLVKMNNNIVVATMNKTLSTFTTKGNCLWSCEQPAMITAIEAIDVERQSLRLIAVALDCKQVHIYQDRHKVDILDTDDTIVAMKYGRFGREDSTLVMVGRAGSLTIKILKRTAKFTFKEFIEAPGGGGQGGGYNSKLSIPKKTKLFVDQTMREREQSIAIHRTFQHDLYRLKLMAARSYVKAISTSLNPMSSNAIDPLKLSAQVHGLGPIFRLILELQNTSADTPSINLLMTFQCDLRIYSLDRSVIRVPFLAPGIIYPFATRVECVSKMNISDIIKVLVVRDDEIVPLITAVINMPASEAPIDS
ncbi:Bardet-Biedl syndrome 1 protein homolog [Oppia nitens]|uniref:Bardet-Biedl syndrome 1 protein homolog n=1 Tax=Oppia nitens TaxID=1686743 RepID=UPI0023DC2F17|nr:Bardet-Biedl syndrome 1 protein homolog [Oppia nitens]